MKSRSIALFEKSLASMLSAIEIYNKPNFSYREETFSILSVNSFELLLKARIIQIDRNRISSILQYEHRQNVDGTMSIKSYRKKNRAGNSVTIGLFKAYDLLVNNYGEKLDPLIKKNLDALIEIRDNSVHFYNKDFKLKKKVLEIGTASLKNYASLSQKWFGADLSRYNFFIMPLGFVRDLHTAECVALNSNEKKLLGFIEKLRKSTDENITSDYALSLEVELKIKRKPGGAEVSISNSPDALLIKLEEENVLEKFPWNYENLTAYLKKRYENFKCNGVYHSIRKDLESNNKYCLERLLDPTNSKSSKKRFYNPNIIKEFDNHYTRK